MTIVSIIFIIIFFSLLSGYNTKKKELQELKDAIDIANNATGFMYYLHQISIIYNQIEGGKYPINFEVAEQKLNNLIEGGIYKQYFSDIDSINHLLDYQAISTIGYYNSREIMEKIYNGKIKSPKNLKDYYRLLSKNV